MIDFSEVESRITTKFSITELEARLKPKDRESKVQEWEGQSDGGFLAPNESLMEIVRADYNLLCSLGKSYEEMAQLAANVLEQASKKNYSKGNRFAERVRKIVAKYWRPVTAFDQKKFTLMQIDSMGFQSCPWECKKDEYGYRTSGSGHVYVMEASGSKFPELNFNEAHGGLSRALYLSAFTVITDLTPHLIASHYFFEGDYSYRTDPRKLLEVVNQMK